MAATITVFPKCFAQRTPAELAELVRSVGADAVDVIVRDGYAVTPAGIKSELPAFVKALDREGVRAELAVTDFSPAKLAEEPDLLLFLADHGIKAVRTGYFPFRNDVREALREARETIDRLVPMCSLSGITAVYQVHHGTLISSASAAHGLVRGGPNAVSIQLDAGNQRIEGYEAWPYGVRLLGKHLAAVGIKDVRLGVQTEWCECGTGEVLWEPLFQSLNETGFDGYYDVMPFYDSSEERLLAGLKADVAFVKARMADKPGKSKDRPARTLLDL